MRTVWGVIGRGVAVLAGAGATAVAVGRLVARRANREVTSQDTAHRWLAVTVNRPPEQVAPQGKLPEPLIRLGDTVEVQVRPAAGGRGSELCARPLVPVPRGAVNLTSRLSGDDPRQQVRRALRDAKSLLETGEVLAPDSPPNARPTAAGRLLDLVRRRASGEGRL